MSSNKIKFDSFGVDIDGTGYCTSMETMAENMIEDSEEEAVEIFPASNLWATPRSSEYKLTTDNAQIILPKKIYKIVHLYVPSDYIQFNINGVSGFVNGANITDGNGISKKYFDLISVVFDNETYQTLLSQSSTSASEYSKEMVFHYGKNENTIIFPTFENLTNNGMSHVNSAIYEWLRCSVTEREKIGECYYNGKKISEYGTLNVLQAYGKFSSSVDFQFRVEYIPTSSSIKLRARKTASNLYEYTQPFNQRAEVNSVSAFGKAMWNEAQKTGNDEITVVKFIHDFNEVIPLGARVIHNKCKYILTGIDYEMTNTVNCKITYTLSKNWANKSRHLAVNQKYRNYAIPQETLWRNLYYEDFVAVRTDGYVDKCSNGTLHNTQLNRIFYCDISDDKTCTTLFFYPARYNKYYNTLGFAENGYYGVCVPCSTYGMANSMIMSASMKDNLSAGLMISEEDSQYCDEALYTQDDGTVDYARIILAGAINTYNEAKFPRSRYYQFRDDDALSFNAPDTSKQVFDNLFYIDKSSAEALKFTYQVHFINDGDDDVVIGNALASDQSSVKPYIQNRTLKFWALSTMHFDDNVMLDSEGSSYQIINLDDDDNPYFNDDYFYQIKPDGNYRFSLTLTEAAKFTLKQLKAVGWAITNADNKLYVACNDVDKTTLYFTSFHEKN